MNLTGVRAHVQNTTSRAGIMFGPYRPSQCRLDGRRAKSGESVPDRRGRAGKIGGEITQGVLRPRALCPWRHGRPGPTPEARGFKGPFGRWTMAKLVGAPTTAAFGRSARRTSSESAPRSLAAGFLLDTKVSKMLTVIADRARNRIKAAIIAATMPWRRCCRAHIPSSRIVGTCGGCFHPGAGGTGIEVSVEAEQRSAAAHREYIIRRNGQSHTGGLAATRE